MYTKQEASRIKQAFWTQFGQYMKPVPSATGEKVNWTNYRTGVPNIFFRMTAERKFASIAIELTGSPESRQKQFVLLQQMQQMLETVEGEGWHFQEKVTDEEGRELTRVYAQLDEVSVFREADWPAIISFLKPRIMALDAFWADAKDIIESVV